jgi:hypothetical protein
VANGQLEIGMLMLCFLHSALRYNCVAQTNEMHTFQINDLIRFSTSSTCLEPHGFIIRKSVCVRSFVWYVFGVFV